MDYTEYYGQSKTLEDAKKLLENIPSESLINYISGINLNLYLREDNDDANQFQIAMAGGIVNKIGKKAVDKFNKEYQKLLNAKHNPILFWNYSNLRYYDLIFENYNTLPCRELTSTELQNFFDAYLIINETANKKSKTDTEEIEKAFKNNELENILITNYIYQKDYSSSLEYANQVVRGIYLFKYLENDPIFGPVMSEYYASKNVSGYMEMFRNLMLLFAESKINEPHRIQILNLDGYINCGIASEKYLDSLSINKFNSSYKIDDSFNTLRNGFLYKIDNKRYYLLNINFLLDHFYKSQVFAVNRFLNSKKITSEFLGIKGKDFSDKIYFPEIMSICFPHYLKYFGKTCKNSTDSELCDGYLRDGNNLILIEFKDVLLNGAIKNAVDEASLFKEFHIKFVENQKGKPKGIKQLKASIADISTNGVSFDQELTFNNLNIYPVIVYTDLAFGADGLNKMYRAKFQDLISTLNISNLVVNDVTFINLNFFEQWQDHLADQTINIFELLKNFSLHTKHKDYELTTFEIFSRFYINSHYTIKSAHPKLFSKFQEDIINSTPLSKRK